MKHLILSLLTLSVSFSSLALESVDVNEEMKSKDLRYKACDGVYFEYFDYGELFEGDTDGSQFNAFCDTQEITIVQKIQDQFPTGKTPAGFSDKITTKMFFKFAGEYSGEMHTCNGYSLRTIPTSGFTISKDGEILTVANQQEEWRVEITECEFN